MKYVQFPPSVPGKDIFKDVFSIFEIYYGFPEESGGTSKVKVFDRKYFLLKRTTLLLSRII